MPDILSYPLLEDVTSNGTSSALDIRNVTTFSVYVNAEGGTSASVQFEGTADPRGLGGWAALAMRVAGGAAYATTAVSVPAGEGRSFYFDPSDNVCWLRAVVSSQSGPTTLNAQFTGEL